MTLAPLAEPELRFLRELNARGVRYVVIGMGAAVLQGATAVTFAFAVFGGGVVDGHWVSRPAWVRRDEVARAIVSASRAILEPLAAVQGEEPGEHEEAAAIASEVLDDLLGERRRRG